MDPSGSPLPPPSPLLTPLLIALAIIATVVLALLALHFLLAKRRPRDPPATSRPARRPAGVDEKVLDSIPVQAYAGILDCQHDCSVCLSALEEGEPVRALPSCRHVFHVQCIDSWFAFSSNCPVCRSQVGATPDQSLVVEVVTDGPTEIDVIRGGSTPDCEHDSNSLPRHMRSSTLVWPSGPRLMSFREKLRLKRSLSLDCLMVVGNSESEV